MTPLGDPKTSWLTPEWGAKERFHRATSGFFEHSGLGDSSFSGYWLAATLRITNQPQLARLMHYALCGAQLVSHMSPPIL